MSKPSENQPIADRAEQMTASWEAHRLFKARKYRAAFRLFMRSAWLQMKSHLLPGKKRVE